MTLAPRVWSSPSSPTTERLVQSVIAHHEASPGAPSGDLAGESSNGGSAASAYTHECKA